LAGESLGEGRPASAFILVGYTDGRVQTRDGTARQTGRPATLLHGLTERSPVGLRRDRSDLEDGAIAADLAGDNFGDGTIDVAARQRAPRDQGGHGLRIRGRAIDVDQTRLNDGIAGRCNGSISARDDVGFEDVIVT